MNARQKLIKQAKRLGYGLTKTASGHHDEYELWAPPGHVIGTTGTASTVVSLYPGKGSAEFAYHALLVDSELPPELYEVHDYEHPDWIDTDDVVRDFIQNPGPPDDVDEVVFWPVPYVDVPRQREDDDEDGTR